jgi:protease-4
MRNFLFGFASALLVVAACAGVWLSGFRWPASIPDGSILVLRLGSITERGAAFRVPFGEPGDPSTVLEIWRTLRKAKADPRIRAVALMPESLDAGWATLAELRADLVDFSQSGKPVAAYLRGAGSREYYLATGAGRIVMPQQDLLNLKGLRAEMLFLRRGLDKLGILPEIGHAGRYKDAGDILMRSSMREESREVLNEVLDARYSSLIQAIGSARKRSLEQVRALIDEGPFLASQAREKGLLDALQFEDDFFDDLGKRAGSGKVRRLEAARYRKVPAASLGVEGGHQIAWLAAEGDILRGKGNPWREAEEIASDRFIPVIRSLTAATNIRGVILRVNSPGGDALASDEILAELRKLAQRKPLVVSMSDVAASGGYSIALSGTPIVGYPETITGSIGVLFGKLTFRGLYDKLGVDKELVTRGRFAAIDSDYEPLGDAGRKKLQEGLEAVYHDFVSEVARSRRKSYAEIDGIAQGKEWLGTDAKRVGLLDELGGVDRAIALIRERAGIPARDKVQLVEYPQPRPLREWLNRNWVSAAFPGTRTGWIPTPLTRGSGAPAFWKRAPREIVVE